MRCFVFKTNKGKRALPRALLRPFQAMARVVRVEGQRVPSPRRVLLWFGLCSRPRASQALSGLLTTSLKGGHYTPADTQGRLGKVKGPEQGPSRHS